MRFACMILSLAPSMVQADTLVATRTIRAQTVISVNDVAVKTSDTIGPFETPDAVIGQETRVALYAGRVIHAGDIGPPAIIERNQVISLIYQHGGLQIETDGRSLSRAGVGDRVRVMNLSSRATVSGRVGSDGRIFVSR